MKTTDSMLVYIAKQFDKREVGSSIDLPESTAKRLLDKGIVVLEPIESKAVKEEKKVINNKKVK